eukprot:2889418-Pyramimonas_sp.AAC.1
MAPRWAAGRTGLLQPNYPILSRSLPFSPILSSSVMRKGDTVAGLAVTSRRGDDEGFDTNGQ